MTGSSQQSRSTDRLGLSPGAHHDPPPSFNHHHPGNHGWTSLGDYEFTSGTIRIVQADNWGAGPYNSMIGWDAAEAVPIR